MYPPVPMFFAALLNAHDRFMRWWRSLNDETVVPVLALVVWSIAALTVWWPW